MTERTKFRIVHGIVITTMVMAITCLMAEVADNRFVIKTQHDAIRVLLRQRQQMYANRGQ